MKTLTIKLPEALMAEIEAESRAKGLSKSDVVRDRLSTANGLRGSSQARLASIADLIGSVEGLPPDLSSAKNKHLAAMGYGHKRPR